MKSPFLIPIILFMIFSFSYLNSNSYIRSTSTPTQQEMENQTEYLEQLLNEQIIKKDNLSEMKDYTSSDKFIENEAKKVLH
jgi:hypothetical protein